MYIFKFLFFIFLACSHILVSQDLQKARKESYFTYIFSINNQNFETLYSENEYLDNKNLGTVVDSFPTDSGYKKQLPIGHYVFVSVIGNQYHYKSKSLNTISADIVNGKRNLLLYVYNTKSHENISDAIVKANGKLVKYHKSEAAYLIKRKKDGIITVNKGSELAIFQYEKYRNYIPKRFGSIWLRFLYKIGAKKNNIDHQASKKGYIAFNKPKYLPNDTVKFKALLLNKNNKYYSEEIAVKLGEKYEAKKSFIARLKPINNGAYEYQFILGDSLKIDRDYKIELYDAAEKHLLITSDEFKVEDYQLNENVYKIRTEKEIYTKGEDFVFYVSGSDANGFNVLDGRVELTAIVDKIKEFHSDTVFVPNKLWSIIKKIDPLGETKITVADSLIPNVDLQLKINAVFNNSNNETQDTIIEVTYQKIDEKLIIKLDSGYVKAEYFINGTPKSANGELVKEGYRETSKYQINYPFREKLDQNIEQYEFYSNSASGYLFEEYNDFPIKIFGFKTKDSVFVNSINPNAIDIYYTIYQGNKEVENGVSKNLCIARRETSNTGYFIYYAFKWQGEMVNRVYNISYNENEVKVNIEQPKSVFPGQTSNIKIKVTDNDKPLKNVNITAYAINSQFGDEKTPSLPYLRKRKYAPHYYKNNYEIKKSKNFDGFGFVDQFWINRFRLDTMTYYKMLFPKKGIQLNYDSANTINAQVSPFLYNKYGNQIPVYIVYIDDYPVYYYDCDNSNEYVFISSPGLHNFRIRTLDEEYYIDSVELKKGTKLDFSIDINNLPKGVNVVKKENKLSSNERVLIRNSVISLYSNTTGKNYLWQENNVREIEPDAYYKNYSRVHRFCGIYPGKINYAVQNKFSKSMKFEPGFDYEIGESTIMLIDNNYLKGEIKLNSYIKERKLGLKAIPISSIKLKDDSKWYKDFVNNQQFFTENGNGTFKYKYEGDSSICLLQINKMGIDTIVKFVYPNYNNNSINNLEPGYYTLTYFTSSKNYFKKDSVLIRPNGVFFMRLKDLPHLKSSVISKKDSSSISKLNNHWETIEEVSLFNAFKNINLHGSGGIKVTLLDKNTLESIPFANVVVYKNGIQVAVATTDIDGIATIKPLPSGIYNLKATYVGYSALELISVIVQYNKLSFIEMKLSDDNGVSLNSVEIVCYQMPLIDPGTKSGQTVTREDYQNLASKDINSVATTVAGVYQTYDESSLNVKGSRDNATTYFIDGIKVGALPAEYHDDKHLRKDFSDYAFWKPNLYTDKNGEVEFKVTFPDNLTKWKTYALALDDKKHSGTGFAETKSFKNVVSNLAIPKFLIQGDSTIVIAKVLNYLPKPVGVKSIFKLNDDILSKRDTIIKTSSTEKLALSSNKTDSIKLNYSIITANGQRDGEERMLPVFPLGLAEADGFFAVLNRDTSFVISIDSGVTECYIQNNSIEFLLNEIESLKNYPFDCMEQTASKLKAVLMEEKVMNYLNQNFKGGKLAERLLKKLEKGQNNNGSWGWWDNTTENIWMTSYILKIINESKILGYNFKKDKQAVQFLLWNLGRLKGNELLFVLNTLSELKVHVGYEKYLRQMEKDSLNFYQKLMIIKIKQENNLPYNLSLIDKTKKETLFNSTYWGEENFNWYDNSINTTLLAYKILEKNDSNHVLLQSSRNYFLELRNQNKWRNTIEVSSILEAILPSLIRNSTKSNHKAKIILSGAINESVADFPYKNKMITKGNKLTVTKSGTSPIYFTFYQRKFNTKPQIKESLFRISSHFESKGSKMDTLIGGNVIEMVVEINCKKAAEYVMINIPIPAGCSYDDNSSSMSYYEIHREYFKDYTSIFCTQLTKGKHIFKIKLQPRFSGLYNINPIKAEQMYFPILNGNNALTKIKIK